jgi:transposase
LYGLFPRRAHDQDLRGGRRPRLLDLTEGQAHDDMTGAEMLGTLGPDCILLADRGYDSDLLRAKTSELGDYANIRPLSHRVDLPGFSPRVYKLRNKIERFFDRIKHCRAIATRYGKQDANFFASVELAASRL